MVPSDEQPRLVQRMAPVLQGLLALALCVLSLGCGDDRAIGLQEEWVLPEENWKQYTVTWFTTNSRVTKRIPLVLTVEEKDNVPDVIPPQAENQTELARMFEQKSEITGLLDREFDVVLELLGTSMDHGAARALADLIQNGETPDVFTYDKLYKDFQVPSEYQWEAAEISAEISVEEVRTYMPEVYIDIVEAAQASDLSVEQVWSLYSEGARLFVVPVLYSAQNFGYLGLFVNYPGAILWRKDILDELGVRVPETIYEWENAFVRYQTRYPLNSPIAWEEGNPVYAATGKSMFGWYMVDGELTPGYLEPEMRVAVATMGKWYRYSYIKSGRFARYDFMEGKSLVLVGVDYKDGSWICERPYWPGSVQDYCSRFNPTAEFVVSPRPVFSTSKKACTDIAGPFGLQVIGFGKHLEQDRDKLHQIMGMIDTISHDEDLFLLVNYGIEGKHWKWDETDGLRFPVRLPGAQKTEELNELNLGEHWVLAYSALSEKLLLNPQIRESRDRLIEGPEAMYSPEQLTWDHSGYRALLNPEIADYWRPSKGIWFYSYYGSAMTDSTTVEDAFEELTARWEEEYRPLVRGFTSWYAEYFE